jgi:hypothetical protein
MAGRDLSAELFDSAPAPAAPEQGKDLSAELFGAAPTAAPARAEPAPYKNKLQALDDAVNMLEENVPQEKVRAEFENIGIPWSAITKHGQDRGSEYFKQKTVPAGIKPPAQPITGEITPAEKTYTEGVVNVGKRAKAGLREATTASLFQAGALKPDQTARILAQTARDRSAAAPSEDIQEGMMKIGNAKTFGDAAYQLAANPRATFTMLVDSLAVSLPMMAPAMALGPAGAVARGVTAGVSSGGLEYGSVMADVLQEKGVNLLDPIAIERAISNPKIMSEIKDRGAKQGLIVGGFDALTAGLAGRFMRPAQELIKAGELTGSAARKATVSAWAKELGVQIAGGSGGEATKQKVVKGEITNPADVLLEGLAELGSAPLEVRSALREAKELQAGQAPGAAPPPAPTTPTEPTIGKDLSAELFGDRKEPEFREEGTPPPPPPPPPKRDIEAETARINKMGIPMSEARRIAESVDRTPENALPPVDTWPDAAVRATLEFQLNKPEDERNEELVNLLQGEVAKRGPVSETQKRIADIADEFVAAGVPPLEARTRAEQQVKEQDEADALAAEEATKGEQRDTGTVVIPSGEGVGVASVPDTGVPPGGPSDVEPTGVVPTAEDVGPPTAGEVTQPAPVEEPPPKPKAERQPTERQQRESFGKAIGAAQPYPGMLRGRVNKKAQSAALKGNFQGIVDALTTSKNELAKKVAELARGLKTKIAIDEDAVEKYTVKDKYADTSEANRITIDLHKAHIELLEQLRAAKEAIEALPNDVRRYSPAVQALRDIKFHYHEDNGTPHALTVDSIFDSGDLPLGSVDLKEKPVKQALLDILNKMEEITEERGEEKIRLTSTASYKTIGAAGAYDAGTDTIRVPEYYAKDEHVLTHEILHALATQAIANPTLAQRPSVQRLNALYEHVKKVITESGKDPYGITNLQEFVAEAWSNPDFQYELSRIPYKNQTAWSKFAEFIAGLLGLKNDTALTEALSATEELVAPTEEAPAEETVTEEATTEVPAAVEAPKKRGRPALTEEEKAARAAAQGPKGKRGRKPLTEEEKEKKKAEKAPERATLAQIVRSVDKLTEQLKNALTPVDESKFDTDEAVEEAEKDKLAERKYAIRELLKHEANPIVRGRPLHKRIKDLLNSPGITEQEKAEIKKGVELVKKVNLKEERLSAAGKASSDPVDSAYSKIKTGVGAVYHIIKTGSSIQKTIASRIRNSLNNIKFVVVEDGDELPAQLKSRKNAEQWERSRALYIENYKTRARAIYVRGASFGESQGANNTTVLHELLHGATNYKIALAKEYIDKGIHLESRLVKAFNRLIDIMNTAGYTFNELSAAKKLPKEISALANYGDIFDDPREFVAYGMTDDHMQEFLRYTEGYDEDTHFFPKFVQVIRDFFGFRESEVNALSDLMLAVHNLMEAPEEATPLEDTATQVSAQARRSAEEIDDAVRKAQVTVEQSRAGEEARGLKLMQLARNPKQILEIFPALWEGAKNAQREVMVRLPTFDFLAKWMGDDVPMLNDMHKNLQNMTGMSTKFLEGAEQIISALQKTFNAEPDQRKKVEDLVLQTTLARIDPSIVAAQERSPTLDAAYRALSPAGKEAYKLLREYYERVHDLYRLLLDDQVNNLEGISDEAKAKLMATIRLAYEGQESIKPFFPLVRRGNFWVATGSGPSRQFFMFESRRDRNKFAKQLRAVNASREVRVGDDVNTLRTASRDASNMLKDLFDAIDKQDLTEPDVKEGLKDAVYQIYLQTMPEQTFRKMFVHRKGIAGFSTDLVRNTATTASKMATQLSRLKYAPILRNNLTAARSLLADRPELTPIVREAQRRVESALSGREAGISDAIAGAANKLSYLWYLSSASSALIQPFSPIISGIPVLGANHGNVTGAAIEIGRMMTFINQYGIIRRNLDGTLSYTAPSLANNEKLPDEEREAVRQMTERGVQDSTYSSLVWGYARTPSANLNGVVGKGKEAANLLVGGLMHHTERLSREALYLASYRLGRQRGLTNDEAIDQAVSDVNEALGDYNIENRPRWMQKGLGKIAFQFKMYPLQMALLALTSLKRMMPFLNAEGKKEAATKFFGLMGSSLMLAGASNMLFFSPIMGLLGWAWKQMGDDEDLPEELKDKDFETWFRTVFLPDTFGHISIGNVTLADIIDRGPLNAITGWDIASRIGLNDLWGRDSKDMKTARESFTAFVIDNFGGPTASLGLSMLDAYEAYALGDYQKAIEKASPSVVRNIVVANKYAEEGVESSRGSELVPKEAVTKGELFGQAIGFRPDRVAAAQASAFKLSGVEQRVMNERATLLKRLNIEHRNAEKTDNYDRFDALIADEITKFNSKNPENAIDQDDIYNSILKRAELRGSERAGVAVTEKNARMMRDALDNLEKTLERK